MLRIRLICVGKLKERFWADAVKEYQKRLGAFCRLELMELPEERLGQNPSRAEVDAALRREAAEIEKLLLKDAGLICLCVEGRELSSPEVAEFLSRAEVDAALRREAAEIEKLLLKDAGLICLCVEGRELSSPEVAELLSRAEMSGTPRLCLVVGGSFGLDAELKSKANLCLSMSQMTFPHHLARVMLLEQLYRGFQIREGTKYHK